MNQRRLLLPFGRPFDRLMAPSSVEGLRAASLSRRLCGVPVVLAAAILICLTHGCRETIAGYKPLERAARIFPDYADCVIPPNIAPLNFLVKEPGTRYAVTISAEQGEAVSVFSSSGSIVIPREPWKKLLSANRGSKLSVDIYVMSGEDSWNRFKRLTLTIAKEEIDPYLVYREMPLYNLVWNDMGVYQRDLRNYHESLILHNRSFGYGCLNCHTFLRNEPTKMVMNVRGPGPGHPPGGMLIAENGLVSRIVDTKTPFNAIPAIYLAWHPSGKAVSFSTNKVLQCFHTVGDSRDVVDRFSDVALYRIDTNTITTVPELSSPDQLETYTTWSPDGQFMYFCSAPKLPIERYKEIRYDLMRIPYDLQTDTWGKLETVLSAKETGLSITLPRFSPDGRFLLFCMCTYGNFPAFSSTSDLYMMDMRTGKHRCLDINSYKSEAYHSWSSNGRWIVFSSKRRDGLFARPYFSYVDEEGKAYKPILLPQKDPAFYDSYIRVYNVPELVKEPVRLTPRELAHAIHAPDKLVKAKLDPRVKPRAQPEALKKDWWSRPQGHAQ